MFRSVISLQFVSQVILLSLHTVTRTSLPFDELQNMVVEDVRKYDLIPVLSFSNIAQHCHPLEVTFEFYSVLVHIPFVDSTTFLLSDIIPFLTATGHGVVKLDFPYPYLPTKIPSLSQKLMRLHTAVIWQELIMPSISFHTWRWRDKAVKEDW